MQRSRAAVDNDRFPRTYGTGKSLFELPHFGTGGQPIGMQSVHHGVNITLVNALVTVRQHPGAHRNAPIDCKFAIQRSLPFSVALLPSAIGNYYRCYSESPPDRAGPHCESQRDDLRLHPNANK